MTSSGVTGPERVTAPVLRSGDAVEALECSVSGHKVFVFMRGGSPWIEMVNDDRPLVRMTLELLPDEAREIAGWLMRAANATEAAEMGWDR